MVKDRVMIGDAFDGAWLGDGAVIAMDATMRTLGSHVSRGGSPLDDRANHQLETLRAQVVSFACSKDAV